MTFIRPDMKTGFLRQLCFLTLLLAVVIAPASFAAQTTETLVFIHTDVAGSVIGQSNAAGNVSWRENYRPYGERTVNSSGAAGNRQFFHGKAFDPDTELLYFGARYYDPVVGRFMGKDRHFFDENNLHSFNLYAYGNNNPYKFQDPNGELPVLIVPALLWAGKALAVVGAGLTAYEVTTVTRNVAIGEMTAGDAIRQEAPGLAAGLVSGTAGKIALKVAKSFAPMKGFRAVSDDELADIRQHGFRPHPEGRSLDSKWFSESRVGAEQYRRHFPEQRNIVEADVPRGVYDRSFQQPNIDRTGPGFAVPPGQQGNIKPNL
jgi:RHS repeat-associated protein